MQTHPSPRSTTSRGPGSGGGHPARFLTSLNGSEGSSATRSKCTGLRKLAQDAWCQAPCIQRLRLCLALLTQLLRPASTMLAYTRSQSCFCCTRCACLGTGRTGLRDTSTRLPCTVPCVSFTSTQACLHHDVHAAAAL